MRIMQNSYLTKAQKWLLRWEWEIIAATGLLSIALGCYGFFKHFSLYNPELGIFEVLYNAIALLSINTGAQDKPVHWALELGRWLAMAAVFYTAVRGFYLVLIQSKIKYFKLRKHVVIFGHTEIGSSLVDEYLRKGFSVVLVDADPCVKDKVVVKQRFFHVIDTGEINEILDQCQINTAQYLFAVTDNDDKNLQIASAAFKARRAITRLNRSLECFVHIANANLLRLCRNNAMFCRSYKGISCKLFNIFENSSRIAFNRFSPDRKLDSDAAQNHHILIIGCGYVGQGLLLQAVRNGHFADGKKLLISIIDKQASEKEKKLKVNYPGIEDIADLNFYENDIEQMSPKEIDSLVKKEIPFGTIFICIDGPEKIIEIAFRLQRNFPDDDMKIIPMLRSNRSVTGQLFSDEKLRQDENSLENSRIYVFNMVRESCSIENIVKAHLDLFARAINEMHYRKYPQNGSPWHKLSEEFKESNRLVADHFEMKIRAINHIRWKNRVHKYFAGDKLSDQEIEMLAAMEHNRYYAERITAGWRKGDVKDVARKIHPLLVKWADLPEEVKNNITKTFVEYSFKSLPEAQAQIIAQKCEPPDTSVIQSIKSVKKLIQKIKPTREEYRKAPIVGFKIATHKLSNLPEPISKFLGKTDEVNYSDDYLEQNFGSMVSLQVANGTQPDYYIIGKTDFETKYRAIPFDMNDAVAKSLWEKLPEETRALFKDSNHSFFLLFKKHPVQLIEMSAIGYPIRQKVIIESPFGPQTKPAGKEGYLSWSQSNKAYYMVNADDLGFPISYMPA